MEKLKRVVIKEELISLTGDYRAAIILNQFIYWSERIHDFDKYIEEENLRIERYVENGKKLEKNNGWIYKTAEDLIDECMLITSTKESKSNAYKSGSISRTTINQYVEFLITNGWLEKRNNPRYKWDRTIQYRVNLLKIAVDLHKIGYVLQDYKMSNDINNYIKKMELDCTILDNAFTKTENQSPKTEIQNPNTERRSPETGLQYQRLHTEITTETTTKNTCFEEVINYLNAKAKTNYKFTTKKTKELIKARISEGFTLEDFKKVIDIKCKEWLKTEYEKYLRPETLFGTKFESYLNQKKIYKGPSNPGMFNSYQQREYSEEYIKDLEKNLTGYNEVASGNENYDVLKELRARGF